MAAPLFSSTIVEAPVVRMRAISRVVPVEDASHVKVKLSFLDVQRLKESLAVSLPLCLPLAGKLVYVEVTGDVVVDCSDPGVPFFEAEVVDMDVDQLATDEAQNIPKFLSMMPEFDGRALPAPVFAVQATRLHGGMALVISTHHAVLDGRSVARFIDLWASACRGSTV
ncbi:hypothetical protein QOZ80_4AG0322910 [Eleusine coracana subsp. coracana]|nr:hypothetical protein QOZ80_4AG0322910 [Eleusine coracana subsp. coracana]